MMAEEEEISLSTWTANFLYSIFDHFKDACLTYLYSDTVIYTSDPNMWQDRPNVVIEVSGAVPRGPDDTLEEMELFFQTLKDTLFPADVRYWYLHETKCQHGLSHVHVIMSLNPIVLEDFLM